MNQRTRAVAEWAFFVICGIISCAGLSIAVTLSLTRSNAIQDAINRDLTSRTRSRWTRENAEHWISEFHRLNPQLLMPDMDKIVSPGDEGKINP